MKFNFDPRAFNKYFSAKAADDLNIFLEKLPQNTSKTVLIVAGIVWGCAAGLGLYTTVKVQELSELYVEREEANALLPEVPTLQHKPVARKSVKDFVDELQEIYKGLEIKGNSSNIIITANSTAQFGQFREVIGHIQNGGLGWRVVVEKLCVGKECTPNPISASLKINKVSVENNSG